MTAKILVRFIQQCPLEMTFNYPFYADPASFQMIAIPYQVHQYIIGIFSTPAFIEKYHFSAFFHLFASIIIREPVYTDGILLIQTPIC